MVQLTYLHDQALTKVVNVASVPQRSPFRYPGGKTWLVPRVREWLLNRPRKPHLFVEPFAGGGIVSLTVAFEGLADSVIMVELDEQVAAVWKVLLEGDAEWLADRIATFKVTLDSVHEELLRPASDLRGKAFQTLLKNRVYHGGILAPGSGVLKYGENGKGVTSRWYPETLRKRILDIAKVKDRIQFIEGDGLRIIGRNSSDADAVFFIDPPYTAGGKKAGARLYTYNELDHEALFCLVQTVQGDFLMTYDNAPEVLEMAKRHGLETQAISMKNTHHAQMTELLVGRSLAWARPGAAIRVAEENEEYVLIAK